MHAGFGGAKITRRRQHHSVERPGAESRQTFRHAAGLNDGDLVALNIPLFERRIQRPVGRSAEPGHADFLAAQLRRLLDLRPGHDRKHQTVAGVADQHQVRAAQRCVDHRHRRAIGERHIAAQHRLDQQRTAADVKQLRIQALAFEISAFLRYPQGRHGAADGAIGDAQRRGGRRVRRGDQHGKSAQNSLQHDLAYPFPAHAGERIDRSPLHPALERVARARGGLPLRTDSISLRINLRNIITPRSDVANCSRRSPKTFCVAWQAMSSCARCRETARTCAGRRQAAAPLGFNFATRRQLVEKLADRSRCNG